MKKTLAIICAIATLGASTAATAQSFSITIGTQDRYERDYRYRDHDRFDRYVTDRELRRWFRAQPSTYRGRCYNGDVRRVDPYTQRRICVDPREYNRIMRDYNRYQRYRR